MNCPQSKPYKDGRLCSTLLLPMRRRRSTGHAQASRHNVVPRFGGQPGVRIGCPQSAYEACWLQQASHVHIALALVALMCNHAEQVLACAAPAASAAAPRQRLWSTQPAGTRKHGSHSMAAQSKKHTLTCSSIEAHTSINPAAVILATSIAMLQLSQHPATPDSFLSEDYPQNSTNVCGK